MFRSQEGEMSAKAVYKLSYFYQRCIGEYIRLLLIDQDIPFHMDWIDSREEWAREMKSKTPFGHCPTLQRGDVVVAESGAIMRDLARRHGLDGRSHDEAAYLDMLCSGASSLHWRYMDVVYNDYERKDAFIRGEFAERLRYLDKVMASRQFASGPFVLGERVSYADYWVWEILDCFALFAPGVLETAQALKHFHRDMPPHRPRLEEYLGSEERKAIPLNRYNRI